MSFIDRTINLIFKFRTNTYTINVKDDTTSNLVKIMSITTRVATILTKLTYKGGNVYEADVKKTPGEAKSGVQYSQPVREYDPDVWT